MVRLGKKGVPHLKDISRAMAGVREMEGQGRCVYVQLDEFELYLSPEKAESLAAQLSSKVRKLRDQNEQDLKEQKCKDQEAEVQPPLPYTTES